MSCDVENTEESYKLVEKTLLSQRAKFFAMLEDKSQYLQGSYNKIVLEEGVKLLSKEKFDELKSEFSTIFDIGSD